MRSGDGGGSPRHGRFITFEGIDGAGKSTHIGALARWLRARGDDVLLTREPGGTPLAEQLRTLVLDTPMDTLTETLLVFAARRDHVQQCIAPGLAAGRTVLCDRFTDASFAYQGGGRGVDIAVLATLEDWVHPGLQPGLTVWFDLPVELAAARREGQHANDRFEQQRTGFFVAVRDAYRKRMEADPERIVRIDAAASIDDVSAAVIAAVDRHPWPRAA